MIYTTAKNVFEAVSPRLEDHEEEIIYPHPSLPGISCNQLGVLYFDEDGYTLVENINGSYLRARGDKKNRSLGTKLRTVWECYRGEAAEKGTLPFIYQKNGNVYDFTKENLVASSEIPRYQQDLLNLVKKRFILNSVLHLIEIEKRWEKQGVTPQELWKMMALPYWLTGARQRFDGKKVRGKKVLE